MFETKKQRVITRKHFYKRVARSFGLGMSLIAISLALGMVGYGFFEHMSVVDAFVNASMIMAGMGPVGTLQTNAGKIFAGFYALYCGLAFVTASAVILSPIVHRFFHKFHVEDQG